MKEVIVALLAVFAVIILFHFEDLFSVSSENSWAVHGREHFLGSSNAPLDFMDTDRPICQDALGHRVQGDADGSKPLALNGPDIHVGTERFGPSAFVKPTLVETSTVKFPNSGAGSTFGTAGAGASTTACAGGIPVHRAMRHWGTWEWYNWGKDKIHQKKHVREESK